MTSKIGPLMLPDEDSTLAGGGNELIFPCSAAQRRAWFINALHPGTTALNIALRWELKGEIDPACFEKALQIITERHEILRTSFHERDGNPVQKVAPRCKVTLPVIDLTSQEKETRLVKAAEIGQIEARRSFDIEQLPLLRLLLLRLAEDHALLLVTAHQMIFDGWSIRLLFHELGTAAQALADGRTLSLPDLPLQYGDYCLWQQEFLASAGLRADAGYWSAKLAGMPYFEVAPDHPRAARRSARGEIVALTLPQDVGGSLEEAARRNNTTVFTLACAAAAAALHRYTGAQDIVFGTQISGRDDEDLENLIGVFINNLVLRFVASGDPPFCDFLDQAKKTVEEALIHQRMPFDKLVELLNPPRDPRRTPLISINFAVLNDDREPKKFGKFELSRQPSHATGALYDLNFSLLRWPEGWRLALEYNPDLFEKATAEQLAGRLVSALAFAVLSPDSKLSAIPPAERLAAGASEAAKNDGPEPLPLSQEEVANAPEARMIALWRDILGNAEIGPQSNFFAHGGHSLAAMRLVTRVAKEFGVKINVASIFEAPTPRDLAALLGTGEASARPWNIVQIQPKGSKTPVIAINNTALYYNLAEEIGTVRPFLGIQLFDPQQPGELLPRRIEEIAADYVRLIRQARPKGPYVLLGNCTAAIIAYEAAHQLAQTGESVPLIVMADAWLPSYFRNLSLLRRILFRLYYNYQRGRRIILGLADVWKGKRSGAHFLAGQKRLLMLAGLLGLDRGTFFELLDWGNHWFLPHLQAARLGWQPLVTKSSVVLLLSDDLNSPFLDESIGWESFIKGRFFLRRIPGSHMDLFQGEAARLIASELKPLLDEIDQMEEAKG